MIHHVDLMNHIIGAYHRHRSRPCRAPACSVTCRANGVSRRMDCGIRRPASGIRHRVCDNRNRAFGSRHPASCNRNHACGIPCRAHKRVVCNRRPDACANLVCDRDRNRDRGPFCTCCGALPSSRNRPYRACARIRNRACGVSSCVSCLVY